MSTHQVARVISEGSQVNDYFEEEKEKIERKKLKEMSKEPIDSEIFKQGLYCMGKTFNNSRYTYLSLNIQNNNLVSIVVSTRLSSFYSGSSSPHQENNHLHVGYRQVQVSTKCRRFKQQTDPPERAFSPQTHDQAQSFVELDPKDARLRASCQP